MVIKIPLCSVQVLVRSLIIIMLSVSVIFLIIEIELLDTYLYKFFFTPFSYEGEKGSIKSFMKVLDEHASESRLRIIAYTDGQKVSNVTFVVITGGNDVYYVETDSMGEAKIDLPEGCNVKILGPSLTDLSRIFLPVFIDLGKLERGENILFLTLTPGAIIRVITIPAVENNAPVRLKMEVKNLTYRNPQWISVYGDLSPFPLYMLNMPGDMVIVPSNVPVKIEVKSDLFDWPIVIDENGEFFILERNEIRYVKKFAYHILLRNLRVIQGEYEESVGKIRKAEEYGVYVGMEKESLMYVNEVMEKVFLYMMKDEDIFQAAYYLKESYEKCLNIQRNVDVLLKESISSFLPIVLLSFMTSIGMASLCFEERSKHFISSLFFFIIFFILLFYLYPGFRFAGIVDYMIAGYSVIMIYLLLFLISESSKDLKTVGGINLVSAIIASLSLALRNMKRRKLRTFFTFMSLITMILGITLLTSVTFSPSIREIKAVSSVPYEVSNMIIISRIDRPLDYGDITWISLQPECKLISLKAQNMPQNKPLGYVKSTFQINGIIGIMNADPNLKMLSAITTPEDLDRTLHTYASALISEEIAKIAGVAYGDEIVISNKRVKIVGFFNPDKISQFRDVDGDFWCPKKITQRGEIVYCSGNEVIITNLETAVALGAVITRSYVYSEDFQSAINLAKRVSLLTSYLAVVFSGENMKYIYFPSTVISVSGFTLIVPLVLVSLNIFAAMISSIYERRKEISILSVIGLNPLHIICIFILESLILGFLAGSIGYILGIISFKILGIFGIHLPINMKTSLLDAGTILGTTLLVTSLSYLIPSLKASTLVTPSLSRKWKLETVAHMGKWLQEIPARIPPEKVQSFINYLCEKLSKESDNIEVRIDNLKREVYFENGNPVYAILFKYSKGGDRPFYANIILKIKRSMDYYKVLVECELHSIYPKFEESHIHEVISLIRKIMLEWISFRDRIIVPLGSSYTTIINIIRNFSPQLLYIVTWKSPEKVLKELKDIMRSQNLLVPNVRVETIKEKNINTIVDRLSAILNDIDTIYIDSDDYLLSIALTLAGIKAGKKVSYFLENKIVEEKLEV